MAETASRLMTPEEFFLWQMDQEDLYELAPQYVAHSPGVANSSRCPSGSRT